MELKAQIPAQPLTAGLVLLLGTTFLSAQGPAQRQEREVFAVRTETPIKLDAVLDEPAWARAEPATDFLQREPFEGEPFQ